MCVDECRSVSHAERIDMFLRQATNCLIFFTLIYLPHSGAENVFRANEGATVHLPCNFSFTDSKLVSVVWTINSRNSTTTCRWNIDNNNNNTEPSNNCIPRFTFNRKSFTLTIENVQLSDSGNYSCKTTRIIPPPTLDNITHTRLQVAGLSLQLLNSSEDTCIHLLCSVEGLNPELVNFTWTTEGQRSLNSSTSYAMNSELHLCKPNWSDGDTITCHARYSSAQFQRSIQLPVTVNLQSNKETLIIICSATAAGVILGIIVFIVVLCKCRKRDENGSTVFSNKVYENFSFAMSLQNTQSIAKPQTEECIYEN